MTVMIRLGTNKMEDVNDVGCKPEHCKNVTFFFHVHVQVYQCLLAGVYFVVCVCVCVCLYPLFIIGSPTVYYF